MSIIKVKTGGITADAITDALIADDVVGTEHLTANEVDTTALGADAVTAAQIADDAISEEHLDVTSITGHTAETSIADGDLVLIHDASASALKKMTRSNFVSGVGGANTPAFEAKAPGDQTYSDASTTVIPANSEVFDSDSAYNTSNYRFTPQTAGKYYCYIELTANCSNNNLQRLLTSIRKNSTDSYQDHLLDQNTNITKKLGRFHALILDLDGSSDYFEATVFIDSTSGTNSMDYSRIGAYKLIT